MTPSTGAPPKKCPKCGTGSFTGLPGDFCHSPGCRAYLSDIRDELANADAGALDSDEDGQAELGRSTAHPGEAVEGQSENVAAREDGGSASPSAGSPAGVSRSVSLTLPWSVLASSNLRRTGKGHSHSPEYRKARENAAALVSFAFSGPPISVPVKVTTVFHPPDRRRRDCPNLLKGLHDALAHGGLLTDDHLIQAWEGTVEDVDKDDAHVDVTVEIIEARERVA